MNKYVRIFGLIVLLCFSFYYTEKIAQFMRSKDPIYESILASKDDYEIKSVDAIIKDDTIIPGLVGEVVNVDKSFTAMKNLGYYSENNFVFDEVKPNISLSENLDKVISEGSKLKEGVSFIIVDNTLKEYFEEMGVPYSILTTKENAGGVVKYGSKLNVDEKNYQEVENMLKKNEWNNDFCYIRLLSEEFCQKKKKIMIEETLRLNNQNFVSNYHSIKSGFILFLENLEIPKVQVLLNQIYFQGLKVLPLEELLSESRS